MNLYDLLVSFGEETAQSLKGVFHDIGALMIVFYLWHLY